MTTRRPPGFEDVPWITPDGYFDPAKFPIHAPIRQCLDPESAEFYQGCRFLGNMASRGRVDAGIFLLGLLRYHESDLRVATTVVECLKDFHDPRCVRTLVAELRRVPSSNTTRRYINAVIDTLRLLPAELVEGVFDHLARDTAFSPKMRARFAALAVNGGDRWCLSNELDDGA